MIACWLTKFKLPPVSDAFTMKLVTLSATMKSAVCGVLMPDSNARRVIPLAVLPPVEAAYVQAATSVTAEDVSP